MNYAQLRSFHAVAQEGGFSAAARKLKVSQPSVTYQVRQLETAFAVELFHRCGRRVELTDLGASLLALTRRFFSVEEETAQLLTNASELSTGTLRVGAGGRCHIMKMLSTFRRRYPGVHVSISINNSEQNLKSLRDYKVDIATFSGLYQGIARPDPDSDLHTVQIGSHSLVLFVAKNHPWAGRKSVRVHELEGQNMVLSEAGSESRAAFEDALENAAVETNVVMEIDSRVIVRDAVAEGIGIGVAGGQSLVPDGRLSVLKLADVDATIHTYVACLRERRHARLVGAFFDYADGVPKPRKSSPKRALRVVARG
jgi:aminoethylphosphonate catabolism LysR family transcriptional regulator